MMDAVSYRKSPALPLVRGTSLPLCLTGGRHTPGSPAALECPLRPGGAYDQRRAAARASAERRAQRHNRGARGPSVDPEG